LFSSKPKSLPVVGIATDGCPLRMIVAEGEVDRSRLRFKWSSVD
jgi:hypothetical protein